MFGIERVEREFQMEVLLSEKAFGGKDFTVPT